MKKLFTMKKISFLLLFFIYRFISANNPIPETPFTTYNFNSNECKFIQHHQSRIFIQPNTFYLDGKLYSGVVNLKYREFVDQLDIVLNKIPMNYSENNHQHILESGGMFELLAYGNGKLLSYAPNKKIQVQLATKFDMVGGETFIFNRNSNTWRKDTPFGNLAASNEILSNNKEDLWNDNSWQNMNNNEDVFFANGARDTVSVVDPTTGIITLQVLESVNNNNEIRDQTFKTLNVDKMEIYNCDRILNEQTVPIIADFSLKGFKEKITSQIFVVYKKRNAVISYYPEQFSTDFKLLPNEDFTIFTFAKDGKIAVLDNSFTSTFDVKLNANKKVIFPMKVIVKSPNTKAELAALTGL